MRTRSARTWFAIVALVATSPLLLANSCVNPDVRGTVVSRVAEADAGCWLVVVRPYNVAIDNPERDESICVDRSEWDGYRVGSSYP